MIHIKTWDRWVFVMPFYHMFSSLIMTPLGVLWYFKMARKDKNYGLIHPQESSKKGIDAEQIEKYS